MRHESGRFPAILLIVLSLTVLVTCYLMSQAPRPTSSGAEAEPAFGSELCTSYLGTPFDCF